MLHASCCIANWCDKIQSQSWQRRHLFAEKGSDRERDTERDRVLSDLRATNCGDSLRLNVKWHSQCKYTHRYTHTHTYTQAYTHPSSYAVRRFEDSLVWMQRGNIWMVFQIDSKRYSNEHIPISLSLSLFLPPFIPHCVDRRRSFQRSLGRVH